MLEFIHVVVQLSILQMYNVRITAVYFVGEQQSYNIKEKFKHYYSFYPTEQCTNLLLVLT